MSNAIPARFKPYFWDVEINKDNLKGNTPFIIERLLDQDNLTAVHWVINNFSRKEIVGALRTQRGFSPITANFWALYFRTPRDQIPSLQPERIKCFKRPRTHWPGQD